MKKLILVVSIVLSTLLTLTAHGARPHQFKNCSDLDIQTLNSILSQIPPIAAGFKKNLKNYSGQARNRSSSSALKAHGILQCVERVLGRGGFTFECNADIGDNMAWTLPLIGKTIKLDTGFFLRGEHYATGVLLHEYTHKCGTSDAAYFFYESTPPRSSRLSSWPMIADTYRYWHEHGFCIPEVNCRN